MDVTLPAFTFNLQRVSLAKLFGLKQVGSGLLDDIAISGSSRFEQRMQAPDSVFNSGNWEDVTFRNGVKHTASASTQLRAGFVSVTPSFNYNEFWAFQSLQGELVETDEGVVEVLDTLNGFDATRDWRLSVSASTRFYGTFEPVSYTHLRAHET